MVVNTAPSLALIFEPMPLGIKCVIEPVYEKRLQYEDCFHILSPSVTVSTCRGTTGRSVVQAYAYRLTKI